MAVFDSINLMLRHGEYIETEDGVFLAEDVTRLLSTVQLSYTFRHDETDRWLEMGFPNRNARYIVQVLRRFSSLITCHMWRGGDIVEFLRSNATGLVVPAGTVGDDPRGLIYCSNLDDAILVKLKFDDIQVIECKPDKFEGRFNAAYECTPLEISEALGDVSLA